MSTPNRRRVDRRRRPSTLDDQYEYGPPIIGENESYLDDSSYSISQQYQQQQPPRPPPQEIDIIQNELQNKDGCRYTRYATSADSMRHLLDSKKFKPKVSESASLHERQSANQPRNTLVSFEGPYPSWGPEDKLPCTAADIEQQFQTIGRKFGFQRDNILNMYDHLMMMLDSRASRLSPQQALDMLHADYIGGEEANYRRWYFAAQMDTVDLDEAAIAANEELDDEAKSLERSEERWLLKMRKLTNEEKVRDLAIYLMLWGEAAVTRYTPETLCFLFKLASDYYQHGDCPDVVEGKYLDEIVIPLYNFFRDEVYERIDGRLVKREKDHDQVINYDDVNQFFWYPTCLSKAVFKDDRKRSLASLLPHERFHALKDVDWKKTFRKTYKEKRTWMHASINFSRVWIIHIVSFWYYISANAPTLYLDERKEIADQEGSVQWSIVALGGAIAAFLLIVGSFAEYSYLPVSWGNARVITRRIFYLFLLLIINAAPTVYCVFIDRRSTISKLVAVIQLLISIATTLFLSITPTSQLFMRKKNITRTQLTIQRFTANFPPLKRIDRIMSICLWICVFTCKLLESYFFLALSFKDPLKVMSQMHIENCKDAIIGSSLCKSMPEVTLGLMFFMDLLLYFLDTYLWYIIWNTIFSVARSFYLGISIWSPWRNIFARLPKRIQVKLVASSDLNIKSKPRYLVSLIWNAIVTTMFREHLINVEHLNRLLFTQVGKV